MPPFSFTQSGAMGTTLCLFACALVTGQPPNSVAWLVVPRLSRGQELVYQGTYTEEALAPGLQFQRSYRLETRVFVLDATPKAAEVAVFTVLKQRGARPEQSVDPEPSSVRLELAHVDLQGSVTAENTDALLVPVDGPPTIEFGAFLELPRGRVSLNQSWSVGETGRPARTWKISGREAVNGTMCLKIVGLQQSDDWDRPRADRTAWRRDDTIWLSDRTGYACRIERTIVRREPLRQQPTQRMVTKYELQPSIVYPEQHYQDYRREIVLAQTLNRSLASLLPKAAQIGPKPFEALLARIAYHTEHQPPTPYRGAIKHAQRRAEAGRRGETPPTRPAEEPTPVANVVAVGRPAPDFFVTDFTTRQRTRLARWLGRPILMVFYRPGSESAEEVLRFAQRVSDIYPQQVTVLAFAMAGEPNQILKQRLDLRLTYPVLSGDGLALTYAVEATPKLLVIDAQGIARASAIGWGPETPTSMAEDLKSWLQKN